MRNVPPQCYSEGRSGNRGTAMAYICNMCGHDEVSCLCERYCMMCKSDNDPRLCSDGCYYCTDCREACDLHAEN